MTPDDADEDEVARMYGDGDEGTDDGATGEEESEEAVEGMHSKDPTGGDGLPGGLDAPVGQADSDPETATGNFYVKNAEETAATLHEVDTGQIFTLVENPGFENHDIVEASLVAQPPMEVSYLVDELEAHYSVPVETSPEPPTRQVQEIAAEMDEMQAAAVEREGEGEIHILRVAPEDVERTAEELHEDEMTYKNAARYGVGRVEIRTDEMGVVSVRFLP